MPPGPYVAATLLWDCAAASRRRRKLARCDARPVHRGLLLASLSLIGDLTWPIECASCAELCKACQNVRAMSFCASCVRNDRLCTDADGRGRDGRRPLGQVATFEIGGVGSILLTNTCTAVLYGPDTPATAQIHRTADQSCAPLKHTSGLQVAKQHTDHRMIRANVCQEQHDRL